MKILFGINGEGMGHAVRSEVIIDELQKEHKIKVVAGGKAYNFLNKSFNTSKIGFFKIIYRNNAVSYSFTFLHNLLKFPFMFLYNLKLIPIMLSFNPDIVITDLEPFTCYLALLFHKKCISIDNQHIINTRLNTGKSILDKIIIRALTIKANQYLVTTFFYPPVAKKRTYLFPPINRKKILEAKPQEKDFILVYQTSKSDKKLIPQLSQLSHRSIVYGLDKNTTISNVQLKKANEEEFIKDLVSCKAVITNGGFTLIGEALHLNKPILSVPVKRQFEQIRNAIYLNRLGYGKYCKEISKKNIENFLSNIKQYKTNLKKYKKEDNSKILKKLKELISC